MPARRQRQGVESGASPVDLAEYQALHGSSIEFLRKRLNTTRYKVSGLLDPLNVPLTIDANLLGRLASLLQRPPAEISAYYAALIARRRVEIFKNEGATAIAEGVR